MDKITPIISIIVPIYKVENYIHRCIDSLISQTITNIEIILVDDGSPDNCGIICDEYAKKDKRIKVIHKKNDGLGMARNSGLEIAIGQYVTFVDSDDYIAIDMYEKMYLAVKRENSDTCLCGFNRVDTYGNVRVFENPLGNSIYFKDEIVSKILINMLGSEPFYFSDDYIGMSVWKVIYSGNILRKNKIKFCSEREYISEDIIFQLDYFIWAFNVVCIPNALYYYCENYETLTKSYKEDRFEKCKTLYSEILRRVVKIGILDSAKIRIERTFIANSRVCIIQEVLNTSKDGMKSALRNIKLICSDTVIQNVLKSYPIFMLPFRQKIFSLFTKFKAVIILYVLVELHISNNKLK